MLEFLENEVVDFFSKMPCGIYTSSSLSSYERLLLHAVSQYHCLISYSKFSMFLLFYTVVLFIATEEPFLVLMHVCNAAVHHAVWYESIVSVGTLDLGTECE
jgi:hypothetical protein